MSLTADESARLFFEHKTLDQQLALIWQELNGGIGLNPGDVEIGAVELKDATTDTRAKLAILTALVAGDIGLPVTDPIANAIFGTTAGAAVITDAAGTLQQYLRGLIALSVGTGLKAAPASYSATGSFTPAAASHVAGDANGAIVEFATMGPNAGRIMLTSASLEIAGANAEATAWRLYLFGVTPPSALADDAAFVFPAGDRASFLGFVDLGTAVDLVDTQYVEANGINKQVKLAGTSLFAYLVNLTTLTPAAVAHKVTLHSVGV